MKFGISGFFAISGSCLREMTRVKYFSFEREFERLRPGVTREAESCKMDFWVTVQKLEFDSSPFLYICFSRGLEVSARS